jgi:hypothetical protein
MQSSKVQRCRVNQDCSYLTHYMPDIKQSITNRRAICGVLKGCWHPKYTAVHSELLYSKGKRTGNRLAYIYPCPHDRLQEQIHCHTASSPSTFNLLCTSICNLHLLLGSSKTRIHRFTHMHSFSHAHTHTCTHTYTHAHTHVITHRYCHLATK